eukprot:GILI01020665.1.p1 GENE.GILI01020665.1~~GILI01020665.1.p1  ORF type:complete len:209 (-),score=42.25 GILI01020665.1:58-684(-)
MDSMVEDAASHEITPAELRRGSLYLTRFEVAKIIGERAVQITAGMINPYAAVGGSAIAAAETSSQTGSMSRVTSSPAIAPSQGSATNMAAINLAGNPAAPTLGSAEAHYENCSQASLATLPATILTGKNHALSQVVDTTVYHRTNIYDAAEKAQQGISLTHDPVMIAKYELIQRRIPMLITRSWPDGWVERVPVGELEVDVAQLELLQ